MQSLTLRLYLALVDAVNVAVNAGKDRECLLSKGEYFRIETLPTSLLFLLPQCTQLWENYLQSSVAFLCLLKTAAFP